jgi:hypothetical protein
MAEPLGLARTFVAGCALLCALAFQRAAAAQSACRPPDVASAALLRIVAAHAAGSALRPLGHGAGGRLRPFDSSALALVSDSAFCRRAAATYAQVLAPVGKGFSGTVHVVRIGHLYAVVDPSYYGPEPGAWAVMVVDAALHPLGTL